MKGRTSMLRERERRLKKAQKKSGKGKGAGLPIPKCPKCGRPYTVEVSKDPQIGGSWKHFYCLKCRGDSQT